ncbi:hypothetical protein [Pedobacter caeni]|uniref:HEPN domain-containing protein n=1 Tax=Pedobacter caeni TaxID=288992 RepID=A0A1M5GTW6_9SPHI|nr:hypothetical protein [Pedobacter caeni]SHG07170.1 hypothetical protein SAMN04488522_104366 [Pedobacter caeni]
MSIYNNGDQNYAITNQNPCTTNHIFLSPVSNELEYENWTRQIGSLLQIGNQLANLKPILDLLIALVEPERMFLLNHEAITDYDIKASTEIVLVINREKKLSSDKPLRTISKVACFQNNNVLLSVHSSTKLDGYLTDGHPYYSSHFKEKHLVFSGTMYRLLQTPQEVLTEIKKIAKDVFEKGIEKTQDTLERAIECEEKNMLNLSALMIHQSLEQIFRTILWTFEHFPFNGTHNLFKLQKHACLYMPQLFGIIDKSSLECLYMAYQSQAMDRFDISEVLDISILCNKVQTLINIAKDVFVKKLSLFDSKN